MAEKYPTVSEVEMPSNDIQPTTASRIPSTVPGTSGFTLIFAFIFLFLFF